VYSVLVCGDRKLKTNGMQVCLIEPEELKQLLDLSAPSQQNVRIKFLPGRRLRVSSGRGAQLVVPRNRFEEWEVPGS
jgi:hypothetical protein